MNQMTNKIPAIVLGGTGYVSGELLRLIIGHPTFSLAGVMSDSSPGELAKLVKMELETWRKVVANAGLRQ